MKELKLKFHSDNGHGWVAVKKKVIEDLGIANSISTYSYQRNDTAYLEEDCDCAKLLDALAKNNVAYEIKELRSRERSAIRNYDRFKVLDK